MRLQESQTSADVMLVTMLIMLTMMTYLVDNIEYCRQVEEERGDETAKESDIS